MPNVELLKRTLHYIETHPNEWVQSDWATMADDRPEGCGTAYCFAGWALTLTGCKVHENGNVALAELPPEVRDRLVFDASEDQDRWEKGYVYAPDAAVALLEIDSYWSASTEHLFDSSHNLDELRQIVAELCNDTTPAGA